MIKSQLISSLKSEKFPDKIVCAFVKVPREKFLPKNLNHFAYEDTALPLEKGATISQPYTIAFMLKLLKLKPKQKVLEIGSGCGYVLALLEEITLGEIYGVEIIKSLAEKSKQILKELNYPAPFSSLRTLQRRSRFQNNYLGKDIKQKGHIEVFAKNGSNGLLSKAPFDRILISAEAPSIPEHLYSQLKENGILVTPYRNSILQITKNKDNIKIKEFSGFVFVPLITNVQQPISLKTKQPP
ncbi:hypothetical protein J4462_05130 [Candidatus Pacearchaeota archaeon]|nr:hypothetical protein [Candidatus Pacearchaeota archaeon]